MPGARAATAAAKRAASCGFASRTLIAVSDSAEAGSAGSAVIAIRSGRCMRASRRLAVKRSGSGVGS